MPGSRADRHSISESISFTQVITRLLASWQRSLAIVIVLGCGGRQHEPPVDRARRPEPELRPVVSTPQPTPAAVEPVAVFTAVDQRLRVEALRDDVVHFELTPARALVPSSISTSPMIARRDPPIPWTRRTANVLETRELRVEVDPASLCVKVTDLVRGFVVHRTCPGGGANALSISRETTQHVYGLGEHFITAGSPDGDWIGRERTPGNPHGNAMVKFDGNKDDSGSVGNAQFPILYALSPGKHSYAMFVDDPYAEHWDFTGDPWTLRTIGDALRWYVIAGPDLPDVRRDYMDLVGHPPVPPKQAFGLWVSEYGFDNWKELEDKLRTLRKNKFPVDGFVLDLQWFGNIQEKSETSRMGTLTWDTKNFPDPERKVKELAEQGIGLVLIEESYVSRGLAEHADLAKRGFLARDGEGGAPTFISHNPWWGVGGMIDWTNQLGADYWHDTKRQPLIDLGIVGHWCDLGEPEMYSDRSWYTSGAGGGHRHIDVHNLFTLSWVESIWRGYQRHKVERRPFMLARSGAPGIQRYGIAMWSGDIGSNLTSLATHLNVQMHMSMSGIDYFGSDISGFVREVGRGNVNEMYTQWFADGMAVDVPGRVHTRNLTNKLESAPDRVGHRPSNLANLRRRYELVPYLYSLAHRAHASGDPVFPPLVWAFQDDAEVRKLGGEKLIGDFLLVALVAKDGAKTTDVYLPKGTTWIGFDDGKRHEGGQWLRKLPLYDRAGIYRLPMFAREGAIVPLAYIDDKTYNTLGKRADNVRHDELRVRVFASRDPTSFVVVEDDGITMRYQRGERRRTVVSQNASLHDRVVRIAVEKADGSYEGAPARRAVIADVVLPLVLGKAQPARVTVDGVELGKPGTCNQPGPGWCVLRPDEIRVMAGEAEVSTPRNIVVSW
jgi:alpha-glucosidase (family GH31 glycosyl hydrolase)